MDDPRIVKEWMDKADEDLQFSVSIIEDSTFYAQICFHFHQAAEKYLKAVVIALDLEFKRIHDFAGPFEDMPSKETRTECHRG